jgi:hypothetical protein
LCDSNRCLFRYPAAVGGYIKGGYPMRKSAIIMISMVLVVLIGGSSWAEPSGKIFRYLSPMPGAGHVMPQSTLIFRPGDDLEISGAAWRSSMKVTGSVSGEHKGRWTTADDQKTVIFRPQRPFTLGETVIVSCGLETAGGKTIYKHSFDVASRIVSYEPDDYDQIDSDERDEPISIDSRDRSPLRTGSGKLADLCDTYSLPPDFPLFDITVCDEPADGKLFLATLPLRTDSVLVRYLVILENDGTPVFFRKMPARTFDFKKQPTGMLSYFLGRDEGDHFFAMDNTYSVVDSYTTANGYNLDMHELLMMPDGHVLLIGDEARKMDLSQVVDGGKTDAKVIGSVIQEFDSSKNLVFQWRSWDHIDYLDTHVALTRKGIRYCHTNAIEVDHDGNILISSRNIDEITKINRETGEIIWRMGGKGNEFTLKGDTQWFSCQHDIRRLDNGNVTIFDNGNFNDPVESRVLEYELDEVNKIATLVYEYRREPAMYSPSMGSARKLPGGNMLVGWGNGWEVDVTEVRPDGTVAFEMVFPNRANSYRAHKDEWEGVAAEPYAWADTTGGELWLHFTKFGDNDVDKFYVYRGTSPAPDWKAYVTAGNAVRIRDYEAGEPLYFRVTAVDGCGNVSPFSNEVKVTPEFTDEPVVTEALVKVMPSTLNLLSEGRWITAQIEFSGECGHQVSDIDRTCILFNDTILVDRTGGNGNIDKSAKKKLMVKFPRDEVQAILTGDCVMVKVSGFVGEFAFEAFDNIRIVSGDSSCAGDDDDSEGEKDPVEETRLDKVTGLRNCPNPFNPVTTISFTLPASSLVNLSVYDVSGRLVSTLVDRTLNEGTHDLTWDGKGANGAQVASGIYFYRLRTDREILTRKMILLR